MGSANPEEISAADSPTNQTRREALKRFGRYAAAAPTVVVLLQPSVGHAGRSKGRGWSKDDKWGTGGGSHY
jgi:hypothetical protein